MDVVPTQRSAVAFESGVPARSQVVGMIGSDHAVALDFFNEKWSC